MFGSRNIAVPGECPACREARRDSDKLAQTLEQQEMTTLLRRQMGVPDRFIRSVISNFREETPAQTFVGTQIRSFVDGGWRDSPGLLLMGNVGTGKTLLGTALVNHWLDHHGRQSARFYTMLGLMRRIKDSWNPDANETQAVVLQRLKAYQLLVIDEIGASYGSDSEHVLFTDLINERYNTLRPTILITNLTVDDCYKELGDRVMDRLRDGGHALAFTWPSQRGILARG